MRCLGRALRAARLGRRVCVLLPGLVSLALLAACAGGLPRLGDAFQPATGTGAVSLHPLGPFADVNGPALSMASPLAVHAVAWAPGVAPTASVAGRGAGATIVASRLAPPHVALPVAVPLASPAGRPDAVLVSACPQAGAEPRPSSPVAIDASLRRDRGFLWRIVRDGRASYLYGTLHFGKPEWMVPGPTVQAALDATNLLALEMDPLHEPAADPRLPARALRKPASTDTGPRAPALPAPLQQRLDQQARAACVAADEWAARALPQQLHALSVLAARPDGLEPAYAQEVSLSLSVRAARRPVLPLETVQEQRRALLSDGKETLEVQADRVLTQLESGSLRRMLTRISSVWERGDLDDLERYESWCDCVPRAAERQDLRRINDERNAVMAARIAAMHAQGHRVFAAVGAMHMVGAQGLPQQMAAQGFQVERVLWSSPFERTAGRL